MNSADIALFYWPEIREYALSLVKDLAPEEMIAQPVPGVTMNHPAWILSHLAAYGPMCADIFRGRPASDPLHHPFGKNSRPEASLSVYKPKDALIAEFRDGYDDAADALRAMNPARLAESTPIERFLARFPTIGHLPVQFFVKHTSLHLGQLSAWRRAGGRPPV